MGDERQPRSADQDEAIIRQVAARVQLTVPGDSTFDARVMQAVWREEREVSGNRFSWLPMHRTLARRWSIGVLLTAAVALVLVYWGHMDSTETRSASTPTATVASPPITPKQLALHIVRFTFAVPADQEVRRIAIAGSFNGWDISATPLRQVGRRRWVVDVPLRPGRYVYQFVINGKQWVSDPVALRESGTDFGNNNSVIMVEGA